jgi:PAS domain S-box-containing protein
MYPEDDLAKPQGGLAASVKVPYPVTWNLLALRDLPPPQRWAVLFGVCLAGAVLLALDKSGAGIQLRPVIFLLLVVATACGGLWFGIAYAVVAASAFTLVEWMNDGKAFDSRFVADVVIVALSSSFIPVIVAYMQRAARETAALEARLRQAETDRAQLVQSEAVKMALLRTEANYRAVGESIPFGIWQTDAAGKLLYVSESFRQLTGMTLEQLVDGGWLSLVPSEDARSFLQRWEERSGSGDMFEGEYRLHAADGKTYTILSRGVRIKDERGVTSGWSGMSLDITDRKRATDAVALLEDVGRQLNLSLDPGAILDRVAIVCAARFADWVAIDIVQDDGSLRTATIKHADPDRLGSLVDLRAYPRNADDPHGPHAVARTGKSELWTDLPDEMLVRAARDERHLELLRRIGIRSAMVVPLIARERVIGTMTLVDAESGRHYTERDLRVAEVLAVRTALAYQNAQHYARESRVADTLQRASLPSELPQLPGLRINATYLPGASESEIGGDWYDAFLLPDGKIGLTIGDVAGKGLRAAVSMGVVRQALRYATLDGLSPSAALRRVNRHLCLEGTGMVTAVSATLDLANDKLVYATAGHPAAYVSSRTGRIDRMTASGLPLGLFAQSTYTEVERQVETGELIVLYTDGLVENDRDLEQGERALEAAIGAEAQTTSPNPALSILHRMISGTPKDDVAILTIGLLRWPVDRIDIEAPAVPASARMLRQSLRRLTAGVGLDEQRAFGLLVAAGEAISNVIEHAYGLREGLVHVTGKRIGDRLVVEIQDTGRWRTPRSEGRGRGLALMRSIVDDADVQADQSGTTVRLSLSLTPQENAG